MFNYNVKEMLCLFGKHGFFEGYIVDGYRLIDERPVRYATVDEVRIC